MRTATSIVIGLLLLVVLVYVRFNLETLRDRRGVAAYLQELKLRARQSPQDARAIDQIRTILNGRWPFAKCYACTVLAELGETAKPAIPDLISALDSGDGPVEREAAIALGLIAIGDERPVVPLMRKLAQEDHDVAWFSAEALGNIGPPALSSVPALERAAQSPIKSLASRARKAIEKLRAIPRTQSRIRFVFCQLANLFTGQHKSSDARGSSNAATLHATFAFGCGAMCGNFHCGLDI